MDEQEVPASDLPDELAQNTQSQSGQEVPADDMPENGISGQEVPENDLPDNEKYSSLPQEAITAVEGAAKGVAGPLATSVETDVLGVDPKDILGRQKANPWISGISEGAGNMALMAAAPEFESAKLGSIGSKAVNAAIQMGLIQTGDEVSKSILGAGDPLDAAAMHIAGATGLGLVTGGIFGGIGVGAQKGLSALENAKAGSRLQSALVGMGHAAMLPSDDAVSLANSALSDAEKTGLHDGSFQAGQDFYNSLHGKTLQTIVKGGAIAAGAAAHGVGGAVLYPVLETLAEKVIGPKLAAGAQKYLAPTLLKAASEGNLYNIGEMINHATRAAKGARLLNNAVEGMFKSGEIQGIEKTSDDAKEEKLDKFIGDGGVNQQLQQNPEQPVQGYAEGGEITNMPQVEQNNLIAKHYPEQNVVLNTAKARVSSMLQQARPIDNKAKLPFDTNRPNPQHERDYKKMLKLANNPLSIAYKVQDGSLTAKDLGNFSQMYPELHQALSKKITKKLNEDHIRDEKRPSHKVRQALSLFLGSNLESSMTPQMALAAQNTFIKPQPKPEETKLNSLNKMANNALTSDQSRTQRLNKS